MRLYSNLVLIANRLLHYIGIGDEESSRLPALAMFTLGIGHDQAMAALDAGASQHASTRHLVGSAATTLRGLAEASIIPPGFQIRIVRQGGFQLRQTGSASFRIEIGDRDFSRKRPTTPPARSARSAVHPPRYRPRGFHQPVTSIRAQLHIDRGGITEQVVHVAENLLIGPQQENPQPVRFARPVRRQRQSTLQPLAIHIALDATVGIAGQIL